MTIKELAKQVEENTKRLDEHLEEIKKNGNNINNNQQQIQQNSYALDILKDYKAGSKRMFIALLIVLFMWFATICYLVYVLNDIGVVEETIQEVEQDNQSGDNNFIGNDGEINYGKAKD